MPHSTPHSALHHHNHPKVSCLYPGPRASLVLSLLLHVLSFVQHIVIICIFVYLMTQGVSPVAPCLVALVPVGLAFLLSGLVCARAAWVCAPGAGGLLPLRRNPLPLACLLAIPFGLGQLVVPVLMFQEFKRRTSEEHEIDESSFVGPEAMMQGQIVASSMPGEPAVELTDSSYRSSPTTISVLALEHTAIRPWRPHDGPTRFHCKAVDGIFEAFVFGSMLEFLYWGSDWPAGDPYFVVPWANSDSLFVADSFMIIQMTIVFAGAVASLLELDHRLSDGARKQIQEVWWYAPLHVAFRVVELLMRVSLHTLFLIFSWKGVFGAAGALPLLGSCLATFLIIRQLGGMEGSRASWLLQFGVAVLCVVSDLFLFVDHPQERRAARRISDCLFYRNTLEHFLMLIPFVYYWLELQGIIPFPVVVIPKKPKPVHPTTAPPSPLQFNLMADDDGPMPEVPGLWWLICYFCLYLMLRPLLLRSLPQPFWDLYEACRIGKCEEVERALGAPSGPDVNRPDVDGYTPLMHASGNGHADICALLMASGATAQARLPAGSGCIGQLLARCIGSPSHCAWSALHLCAAGGSPSHERVMRLLLRGIAADDELVDVNGDTPLHIAARKGHTGSVRAIVDVGPALWLKVANRRGQLPRDVARGWAIRDLLEGRRPTAEPLLPLTPSNASQTSEASAGALGDALEETSTTTGGAAGSGDDADSEGWPLESLQVKSFGGPKQASGLCRFVAAPLLELLRGPLATVPEEDQEGTMWGHSDVRGGPSIEEHIFEGGSFVLPSVSLQDLEPCDLHTGAAIVAPAERKRAWKMPPARALIGMGEYGRVYRARSRQQPSSEAGNFAVKCIEKSRTADRENEVSDCVRQRPHPCIVRVHDVADMHDLGLVFIAMEYCPGPSVEIGCTLESAVRHYVTKPEGIAPEDKAKRWFAETFLGLEHVHRRMKALLRDLKHSNVGLDSAGHVKLLDFGLGRLDLHAPNAAWTFGAPPGSPGWAAPEIFKVNSAYDYHCDFYSLGVLLWVLRTGGLYGSAQPPAGRYGQHFRLHFRDHIWFEACLNNPEDYGTKEVQGIAKDLVKQLTQSQPDKRGDHAKVRQHPWLADLSLPSSAARFREVDKWVRGDAAVV